LVYLALIGVILSTFVIINFLYNFWFL